MLHPRCTSFVHLKPTLSFLGTEYGFFWVRSSAVAVLSARGYHTFFPVAFSLGKACFFVGACCYARALHWRQAISNSAFQWVGYVDR
jgi:hypothetical protein